MVLKSYSKINLSLNINKKLKSGLHQIQSYFCLINLYDKIIIKKINKKRDIIIFKGLFFKHINKKNNSISNLLKYLRKSKLISDFYSVTTFKNIPVFSGLGGGTSNAAFILKFLLKKKKITKKIFNKIEKIIGSDLRLFFISKVFWIILKTSRTLKKNKN